MCNLLLQMSGALDLKAYLRDFLEVPQTRPQARSRCASGTVLRTYWRSFLLYLRVWEVAELGPGLKSLESLGAFLSSLWQLGFEKIDTTTETSSLQRRLCCFCADMVIFET